MEASELLNLQLVICTPKEFSLSEKDFQEFKKSGNITMTEDVDVAIRNADIVITDTWVSMGDNLSLSKEEIKNILMPYQVNQALMNKAAKGAIFSHCLPAMREEEVTHQVLESSVSKIFDEAEYRLHAQKAILLYLLQE